MHSRFLHQLGVAAVVGVLVSVVQTAEAGQRGHALQGGYVVAVSQYGNGEITGRVRRAILGLQVRMPGGTWLYCRRSCSETLRVNTVDIWEGEDGKIGALQQENGLLSRWLHFRR